MKLDVSSRHGFSAKQTKPIHMAEVGMRQKQMIDRWISNKSKLPSQIPCRFDKESLTSFRLDANRNGTSVIFTAEIFTTSTDASWLGTAPVLGNSKQCNDRHDESKRFCIIDIFRGKTSSETPVWIELTELWHDRHKYPSLARNRGCVCVGQSTPMMLPLRESVAN